MARHVMGKKTAAQRVASPAAAGGTPGVRLTEPNERLGPAASAVAPGKDREPEPEVQARRYRVVGGKWHENERFTGYFVMYDGQRVRVHTNKEYADGQVDLDLLRRQGVQFEEIPPTAPAAPSDEMDVYAEEEAQV